MFTHRCKGTAIGNICKANKDNGIWIRSAARPAVNQNTCQDNGRDGIQYTEGAEGEATGNICSGNAKHGISYLEVSKATGMGTDALTTARVASTSPRMLVQC
ncbi:MAG: right-handed parallel beta-helix repeat-containing protein [Anaerolineae bacterium]|nr:MAG: right-handed parallel beta-helix repeat-containing protein [Anaerolineae bacterium]